MFTTAQAEVAEVAEVSPAQTFSLSFGQGSHTATRFQPGQDTEAAEKRGFKL